MNYDNEYDYRDHDSGLCFSAILLYDIEYVYILEDLLENQQEQIKRNKADKNMNTRRLCGKNNITNKKYLIYTAKRSHNNRKKKS